MTRRKHWNKPLICIGTSGWSYDHWRGAFYPLGVSRNQELAFYAEHFKSVEINSSFYHLPTTQTLLTWHNTVPQGFVFAVKASRYITHMKKLTDPQHSVSALLERISVLGDKLGPILFQLPPRWHVNTPRLATFLASLSKGFRYAFEFRDHSWLNPKTYALLAEHEAAFCIYDLEGFLPPKEITTDFVYVRLHGPNAAYQGGYDERALSSWAQTFSRWWGHGKSVYCYFDNDQAGYAPQNALSLQSMLAAKKARG